MADIPRKPPAAPAARGGPEARTEALRGELLDLRQRLGQVQQELNGPHTASLLEANECLVLAALQAETIAEAAMARIGELTRATQRDALTDTPNRMLMLDRLQSAILMARRHSKRVALLFIDLDHFKDINDTHGHLAGDEILRQVARRLEAVVRESDTVSRHSGDEFLVLLYEISQASDATQIAEKALAAIAALETPGPQPRSVSASIGIALYPQDGDEATSLIGRADAAMYRAKRSGGGGFVLYGAQVPPDAGDQAPGQEPGRQPDAGHGQDLRDTNEQLVLSLLDAQEREADAARARLQQVRFLAIVAHELRNPLAPIRMAARLLDHARADEQRHARLQGVIQEQVTHMARLIDDLIDGSRVETGKFHLQIGPVDLARSLDLAADACRPAMALKHQHLDLQVPREPLAVQGDPVRLAQIFRNLLENASRYSAQGGSIALHAVVRDGSIVTTVSDDGIGITAEALPHVFDLFMQDPRAIAADTGGLGIGLAVVRELVQAHGGKVTAGSAGPQQGSQFVVTLPCTVTGQQAP